MTDSGDGQSLLGGSGGKQRPGAAEEDPFQLPAVQQIQKIPAQGNGAASAAGTAGVNVLGDLVENQGTAVCQLPTQGKSFPFAHFQQQILAQLAKIPGDDEIEVLRSPIQILHMGPNGLESPGG